MIAVIEVWGKQYIVKKGDQIVVDRIDSDSKTLSFAPLLVSDEEGKDTKVGTPTLDSLKVECKVIEDVRGDKIRVFKMKAKKRYARTKGFRAALTKLEITSVPGDAPAKTSSADASEKSTTSAAKKTTSSTKKTSSKKSTTKAAA